MMFVTGLVAWPFAYASRRLEGWQRGLRLASGVVSLAFGLVVAYRMGIANGLFGANPTWTPR
jgi:high-affinity nickel-transport protein